MDSLEAKIPAFPSWKALNITLTMPDVFKKEESVTRLVSIIKSDAFENSFVYEKDASLPYSLYQEIIDMYNSFTVWILGRFFHAMGNEKLYKMHDTFIDVQKYILLQLSKMRPKIFRDLIIDYGFALEKLVEYTKENNGQVLVLNVLKPSQHREFEGKIDLSPVFINISTYNTCVCLINNLTILLQHIIPNYILFSSFDNNVIQIFNLLSFLLSKGTVNLKLHILKLYVKIIDLLKIQKQLSSNAENTLEMFYYHFEYIIFETYRGKIGLSNNQYSSLESILMDVYNNFAFIKNGNGKAKKLTQYLFENLNKTTCKYVASEELIKKLYPYIQYLDMKFENGRQFEDFLIEHIEALNSFKITILKKKVKSDVLNYYLLHSQSQIQVYSQNVSKSWNIFSEIFSRKSEQFKGSMKKYFDYFNKISVMLHEITLEIRNYLAENNILSDITLMFFDEAPLLLSTIMNLYTCLENEIQIGLQKSYSTFFINLMLHSNSQNLDIIFTIIAYPLLKPDIYVNDEQMPSQCIGCEDTVAFQKALRALYAKMNNVKISKSMAVKNIRFFLEALSSGLLQNLNEKHIDSIQCIFLKIYRCIMKEATRLKNAHIEVIKIIPHVISIFPRIEACTNEIFMSNLNGGPTELSSLMITLSQHVLCTTHSPYTKKVGLNEDERLSITILCKKCDISVINCKEELTKINMWNSENLLNGCFTLINFSRNQMDPISVSNNILQKILDILGKEDNIIKISALQILPHLANHVEKFNSIELTRIWFNVLSDKNTDVRKVFSVVMLRVLKNTQESSSLSEQDKRERLGVVLEKLMEFTKRSLQFSDFELQDTLLLSIKCIIDLKSEYTVLPLFKIILYFVMVPTSRSSLIAIERLYYLAEVHKKTPSQIFISHKRKICEIIVHLCSVNHIAMEYTLRFSLKKISAVFGFTEKDFVIKECQCLLPCLVAKIKTIETIEKLIEEMAMLMDIELPELLASKYGYIFLQTFLNQCTNGVYKAAMDYVERVTGLSGENLRRKNFKVILNNLLLHFHNKNREVVLALHLLAKEDTEKNSANIPEYLQSHFLGVLQFFLKTIILEENDHEETLHSLSDIVRFMGYKYITPLRFKIISMLQTLDYKKYPLLISNVWFTFLKCCEVEMLGPQLATIFKSLQLLIDSCPDEVNEIYSFLVIENETKLSDNIKDLFFIKNSRICPLVLQKLNIYASEIGNYTFKQKIKWLLKYLSHESIDIRVEGMKELKIHLEKNREELDRMILGYNGIDDVIVELIDVLMLTCREKDKQLKLSCADVIGELGAIEPSHLPRRYALDSRDFSFFIYEENFIINALNELTKALQAEKNAVNMDRTALAIQEMLKNYGICPAKGSNNHSIWDKFSLSQQELMMPLVSSRYISALNTLNFDFTEPIYGSTSGSSFQSWLFNWTCSLISKLPPDRRILLECCLPSMKEGERILMHFLPHILLHALIEGDANKSAYDEFLAVLGSLNERNELNLSVLSVVAVPFPGINSTCLDNSPKELWRNKCTKIIFILLDFLERWLREWEWLKKVSGRNDPDFKKVKNFMNLFCKLQLAKCSYQCGEYPRALMYLEDFITENPVEISDNLSFLAKIYAQLDEPDGVGGIMALRQTEPSIEDRILALEVSGKLADAAACYERIKPPLKIHHLQGLVQCYLDLDNVHTALNFAYGAMSTHDDYRNVLMEMQAEPLWRLGRFDKLESLLENPEMNGNESWGAQIGKALIYFDKGDPVEFKNILDNLKLHQIDSLGAASLEEGAYQHGYIHISRLHSLIELQQVEKFISELLVQPNDDKLIESVINKLKSEWNLRIKVVQESIRIVEPILCLRRIALERGKRIVQHRIPNAIPFIDALLGECWLHSAKTARSAKVHQQAYTYTLKAEEYGPPDLFIEKARLYWLREENEQAITTLKRGLAKFSLNSRGENIEGLSIKNRKLCAEARLLVATYNDSTSNVEADVILQNYKDAYEVYKGWEKSMVMLGQYYDRRFQMLPDDEMDSKASDVQIVMIKYFGTSLLYGSTYVYQSLPRLLSIWFDYGTRLLDVTQTKIREERRSNLFKMTHWINTFLEKLPVYIFLTAFSQLVSRICHPQKEVYIQLKSIIIKLLLHYPQQTLWMVIPIIKSSYSMRAKRCLEIFTDPQLKQSSISTLLKDFTAMAEKLIELCNKEISTEANSASVNSLLRSLPRLLSKNDFSEIMMPTHKFRKLVLPNPDFTNSQHHNPFPNEYVHIAGIDDEMTIISSLQRPRKIVLRGSDGKGYIQMLKPKDDLRKDFRLMEFNDIVNQLLVRDAEARERRLSIRLYSVAPLNEECGLVEWVPNLVGLRPILMTIYNQKGQGMRTSELKQVVCALKDSLARKREVFEKQLLLRHPPILGEWFRKNFPDAQSWLTARTAFIRTSAVMSMVGYILGLGDRHGENILLDSTCGDVMHVDFNCLFNKGEAFEYPERVPFRLTHNMVSAMGPLGVEGMFRKSCVCSLGVLRTNTATLMSIVTPFVYDPLVSWPRIQVHAASAERTNEQAVDHIKNIERRLKGVIKTRGRSQSLSPLSVEGQTNYLIKEAMNIDNLCQMYFGWGPFL